MTDSTTWSLCRSQFILEDIGHCELQFLDLEVCVHHVMHSVMHLTCCGIASCVQTSSSDFQRHRRSLHLSQCNLALMTSHMMAVSKCKRQPVIDRREADTDPHLGVAVGCVRLHSISTNIPC